MGKPCTIDRFFKRKNTSSSEVNADNTSLPTSNVDILENPPTKSQKIDVKEIDIGSLERDPRLRIQIWDYHVNQGDEIRRAYIKAGPYQPILLKYPKSRSTTHLRSFQPSWFKLFPSWLEYSPSKDQAFTVDGFQNWKKVRDGAKCAFLNHIGKDPNSFHNVTERSCEDLMNQFQHIQKVLDNFTFEQILDNRLRLKVSIDTIRLLAFQGCAFRGRDERPNSINRGNFLQIVKLLGSYNDNVAKNAIREEIGDAKYCIIADEARDKSKKEQMAIVLRFVDKIFRIFEDKDTMVQAICELALVAASKDVIPIHKFFPKLTFVVNIVGASCKRNMN
ncbi:uncharacterized protein LOC114266213 [Camellia sinensis]|uniref:uncharacterized protein LOC114266213 n=1 Tax=Camellia sinensis TaxID=4442 RepID=UPI00103557D8|nr:uncharacterized protein LOC114266213 [Camellia sinensis]